MLEKDIEKKVCDWAKGKGVLSYKFTSPNRRSVPDRMYITPKGKTFFIEFKKPGGKPTEGQKREIARLKKQNVDVFLIDDVEKGTNAILSVLMLEGSL